ncbi:17142_t:CDS:2, partial [Dentiscutata heterogama]
DSFDLPGESKESTKNYQAITCLKSTSNHQNSGESKKSRTTGRIEKVHHRKNRKSLLGELKENQKSPQRTTSAITCSKSHAISCPEKNYKSPQKTTDAIIYSITYHFIFQRANLKVKEWYSSNQKSGRIKRAQNNPKNQQEPQKIPRNENLSLNL